MFMKIARSELAAFVSKEGHSRLDALV
eukprot:symbB.v1.2.043523.t1/scaffold15588.1/size769/1